MRGMEAGEDILADDDAHPPATIRATSLHHRRIAGDREVIDERVEPDVDHQPGGIRQIRGHGMPHSDLPRDIHVAQPAS